MNHPEIRLIKSDDIDRQKWDDCIRNATFGIAYAWSWYLDGISPGWHALVWGDYLYVMPLPNNRKYGFSYIFQPFFNQQLGVFSSLPTDPEIVNQFLQAIPENFRLTDLKLNIGNRPTSKQFRIEKHTTHHLDLSTGIDEIRKNYSVNTSRNIKKAIKSKVSVLSVYDVRQFIAFTRENLHEKSRNIKEQHYDALQQVISFALYQQVGEILGAFDEANSLVAAAFFVTTNQKSIYLAASSNHKGVEQSAMFLLIDTFIARNAGNDLVLDFEGSDIQGIARFYKGFGGIPETYFSVHQNRLPWIFRFLKK
jgi:hypothetical protein